MIINRLVYPALGQQKVLGIIAQAADGLHLLEAIMLGGDDGVEQFSHQGVGSGPENEEGLPLDVGHFELEFFRKGMAVVPVMERGAAVMPPEQGFIDESLEATREELDGSETVVGRNVVEQVLKDLVWNLVERGEGPHW